MAETWKAMWAIVKAKFPDAILTSSVRQGDPGYHGKGQAIDIARPYPAESARMLEFAKWIGANYPNSTQLIHTPGPNILNGKPFTYDAPTRRDHYNHVHWAMATTPAPPKGAPMALPSSDRRGARVIWIAIHSAEGARTKEDLYAFFNRNQNASSHVGIDGRGIADWVPRERYAWTLLNGNPISVNAELCAFARWTRAQWLSTGWVDGCYNPREIVRNTARWVLREAKALGIPLQYIGTDGVRARRAGVIIHWDYSKGTGNGDHWDTGNNFPFDVMFQDIRTLQGGTTPAPEPTKKVSTTMDFLVKAQNTPAVFVVTSTCDGFRKRHIGAEEFATLTGCGAVVHTRPDAEVNAIPSVTDTQNLTGAAVHNYHTPTGSDTPAAFRPAHEQITELVQTTRSIAESLKSHIENPPAE